MSQEMKHTKTDLIQMQSLPLEAKIVMTQRRIREWYEYWGGRCMLASVEARILQCFYTL